MDVQAALSEAIGHLQSGRTAEAEGRLREILAAAPNQPDALHFLGILSYQQGRVRDALELIEKALATSPDYPDAHNSLGNINKEQGYLDLAAFHYRRAIELRPMFPEALGNLGSVLRAKGDLKEAAATYRRAIALRPDSPDVVYNLGNVLRDQGLIEEAVLNWRRVLISDPGHGEARRSLGHALVVLGREPEAIDIYEDWIRREPDNPAPRHLLAACTGGETPSRAPDDYVRSEFDRFATSFEAQLQRLDYQGPELVATQLKQKLGDPDASLDVLDGGCGTGLTAEILKPFARTLTGVDLAPRMLAQARERGVYDELLEAELTGHLLERPSAYDLIVIADTLVYFGDLAPVLAAAHDALQPGGLLVVTVEKAQDGQDTGYRLRHHGRYNHREDYLTESVDGAGFADRTITHDVLRMEAGDPVPCMVVTARRPE